MNYTFEQAKQAVAEKQEWKPGGIEFMEQQFPNLFAVINEAAELYMRHAVNEAVIEDRKRITASLEEKEIRDHRGDLLYTVDHLPLVLEIEPLPFPEEA